MQKNSGLHGAQRAKKDEFYTRLADIENELRHYKDHFKGKTVYCNCDDPEVSNFFKYFSLNFKHLGLKKLITSCYRNEDPSIRTDGVSDKAVWLEYTGEHDEGVVPTAANIGVHAFDGDGDFRSEESIELLKEADIVVTNPPFSIFREYLAQLMEYDKKFIIIGNINAITYKEVFPLLKDNKMWLGYSANTTLEFIVPDSYPLTGAGTRVDDAGYKYIKVPGIAWYTNLDIRKRYDAIVLFKEFNHRDYPKYDNYDAIEVSKVADIPVDYDGVMGVPITFLTKHNPNQFDILGITTGRREFGVETHPTKWYINAKQVNKDGSLSNGSKLNTRAALFLADPSDVVYYTADNVAYPLKRMYARILIKQKKRGEEPT